MEFIKKQWKWIASILLILLIGYGYWRYTKQEEFYKRVKNLMEIGIFEEREFEDIEFETTNTVYNTANKDFYDEVVQVGLREMGMDSIVVSIKQITQSSKDKFDIDTELRAHILPNSPLGNNYVIWIDDMGRFESIVVLSHELIHLSQYQNKELIIEEDGIVWKRIKFTYQDISYMDYRTRPWERDAFNKEKTLRFKIQDILYGDN